MGIGWALGAMSDEKRTNVTIVTGFLGSGKTTIINRFLASKSSENIVVIVNEFGQIGVDGDLFDAGAEEILEFSNGCVCCVVRGDLIRGMRKILSERSDLDRIIIETSGIANPGPVVQSIIFDRVIASRVDIGSVLCLVDAERIEKQLIDWPTAAEQLAFSDTIILNRLGDTDPEWLAGLVQDLKKLNVFAEIVREDEAKIQALIDKRSFDEQNICVDLDTLENNISNPSADHIKAAGITSLSLIAEQPLDQHKFNNWLSNLLLKNGENILRTKGIVWIDDEQPLIIQAVNMTLDSVPIIKGTNSQKVSRLVFIGRNLNSSKLRKEFEACIIKMKG